MGAIGMYTLKNIINDVTICVRSEESSGTISKKYEDKVTETNTFVTESGEKIVNNKTTYIDGTLEITVTIDDVEHIHTEVDASEEVPSIISTVNVETEFKETIAVARVLPESIEEAIEQLGIVKKTIGQSVTEIRIAAFGEGQMKTEFQMPYKCISSMDEKEQTVIFESSSGLITMDSSVLKELIGEAKQQDVLILTVGLADESECSEKEKEFFGDNTIIFAEAKLNDMVIHELNGDVTVRMPVEPKEGESYDIVTVYYFDEDTEESEKFDASYDPETKLVSFVTGHFSHFVVIFGDHPEPGPEPEPEPDQPKEDNKQNVMFILSVMAIVLALFALAHVIIRSKK